MKIQLKDAQKYIDEDFTVKHDGRIVEEVRYLPQFSSEFKYRIQYVYDDFMYAQENESVWVFELVSKQYADNVRDAVKYIESKKYLFGDIDYGVKHYITVIENVYQVLSGKEFLHDNDENK